MITIFMHDYCPGTILTSKKIHKEGMAEHLKRRRQIVAFLEQQFRKLR